MKDKVIRTIGIAKERFEEDALRILRAVRFAAQLGFEIEKETQEGIRKLANTKALFHSLPLCHLLFICKIVFRCFNEKLRFRLRQVGTAIFPRTDKHRLDTGNQAGDLKRKCIHSQLPSISNLRSRLS